MNRRRLQSGISCVLINHPTTQQEENKQLFHRRTTSKTLAHELAASAPAPAPAGGSRQQQGSEAAAIAVVIG